MPVKLIDGLPSKNILKHENASLVVDSFYQNTRPLEIAIVNLMPLKDVTELQLLRLLGSSPLQINVTFVYMASHISKNVSADYLSAFYCTFSKIHHQLFDGLIITGAPIENFPFEEVTYWRELTQLMDWSLSNVRSVLHICWGAQAALYHHYGIPKYPLAEKVFGVYPHTKSAASPILRGFDDIFHVPQSRHTEIRRSDIEKVKTLRILAESDESGIHMLEDGRQHLFVTGHSEYDPMTLQIEYERDLAKGHDIEPPKYYSPQKVNWRAHASLFFNNWIRYYVVD